MWNFSDKQRDFILNSDARYNIAVGSVRSGKSVAANIAFLRACDSDIPGDAIIIGRTESSIMNNIMRPFSEYLGSYFHFSAGKRQIKLPRRTISVVGASDVKAEAVIRGSTYSLALVDEITVIPEAVFKQLGFRLSIPGAKLFGTTNPDSPYHWFKQEFLDRRDEPDMNMKLWNFTFDDNPSLTEQYIREIKASVQGLWYKRFIDGLWVLAEGAIFDFFDESLHTLSQPPMRAREYCVGIDYGTKNPCVFSLIGHNPEAFPQIWLEKVYYYDSQKSNRQKTDSEYAQDLAKFVEGYGISAIYIDPSAASFKAEMRKAGIDRIFDADNDVVNGIRTVGELLYSGAFKIVRDCKEAIHEFSNYLWDTNAAKRGIEKPLKQNDHAIDSMRYVLHTRYKSLGTSILTEKDIAKIKDSIYNPDSNLPSFFRETGSQSHYYPGGYF